MKSEEKKAKEEKAIKEVALKHQGKRVSFFSVTFTWPDGSKTVSDLVTHPGAVAILPVNDKGNLLLIRQWRKAPQTLLIEVPAGALEPEENTSDCAIRELQEEIGYKPLELISLGGFYTSPGFCNEYIHLFIGRNLTPSQLIASDSDGIDVIEISLEEALSFAYNGTICDSKTISALCLYQLWLSNTKR